MAEEFDTDGMLEDTLDANRTLRPTSTHSPSYQVQFAKVHLQTRASTEPTIPLSSNGEAFLLFVEYASCSKVDRYSAGPGVRLGLEFMRKFVLSEGLSEIARVAGMFSLEVAPLILVLCFIFAGSSATRMIPKLGCYVASMLILSLYTLLLLCIVSLAASVIVALKLSFLRMFVNAFTGSSMFGSSEL